MCACMQSDYTYIKGSIKGSSGGCGYSMTIEERVLDFGFLHCLDVHTASS